MVINLNLNIWAHSLCFLLTTLLLMITMVYNGRKRRRQEDCQYLFGTATADRNDRRLYKDDANFSVDCFAQDPILISYITDHICHPIRTRWNRVNGINSLAIRMWFHYRCRVVELLSVLYRLARAQAERVSVSQSTVYSGIQIRAGNALLLRAPDSWSKECEFESRQER